MQNSSSLHGLFWNIYLNILVICTRLKDSTDLNSLFNYAPYCAHAVGDLHGDLDKAKYALQMAGVLSSDAQDLWIGGQTVCMYLLL